MVLYLKLVGMKCTVLVYFELVCDCLDDVNILCMFVCMVVNKDS